MVFLRTKETTKKQQEDASLTNVAAADSVTLTSPKMKIGQMGIQ